MKKALIVIAIIAIAAIAPSAYSAEKTYTFKVTGMHCDMCPKANVSLFANLLNFDEHSL